MKKVISITLSVIMVFILFSGFTFASDLRASSKIRFSVDTYSEDVIMIATQFLTDMKTSGNSEIIGFATDELYGLYIGSPFSIYVFDEDFQMLSSDNLILPLLYQARIVGVIEAAYNPTDGNYTLTFGKSYGDELENLRKIYNATDDLFIGRVGDKLFASDGNKVTVLLEIAGVGIDSISVAQIESYSSNLKSNVAVDYVTVTDKVIALDSAVDVLSPASDMIISRAVTGDKILSIPHVAQTGVCGVAAWAAILNYRFKTSYTNDYLAYFMYMDGFIPSITATPTMSNYVSFANYKHNAGAVLIYYRPSYDQLKSLIDSSRPIMGDWEGLKAGNSTKLYHAVIIHGYVLTGVTTNYYYVKNPWYTYSQTITVTNPNSVIYVDGSYTWTLMEYSAY